MLFSLKHKHKHKRISISISARKTNMFVFLVLILCLCASENSVRQISGFVPLMFLLMLTLMSWVFSLVMLMLCLCASENQPLGRQAHPVEQNGLDAWRMGRGAVKYPLSPPLPCQQYRQQRRLPQF